MATDTGLESLVDRKVPPNPDVPSLEFSISCGVSLLPCCRGPLQGQGSALFRVLGFLGCRSFRCFYV